MTFDFFPVKLEHSCSVAKPWSSLEMATRSSKGDDLENLQLAMILTASNLEKTNDDSSSSSEAMDPTLPFAMIRNDCRQRWQ